MAHKSSSQIRVQVGKISLLALLALGLWLSSVPHLVLASGLEPGALMPSFEARNQDGRIVKSEDFKGKPVVVFFYPKDFTPGCTAQACQFRDNYSKFRKLGAVVLGISRQDGASHQKFRKEHHLPYDLLSDEEGLVGKALGVESMPVLGLSKRQSVLFGPDSRVIKFYDSADPDENAREMLNDLEAALGRKR